MKTFIIIFISSLLFGQSLQINEIVSSNSSSFYDENGDTPDWIEIYNSGRSPVNLNGYGLSDDLSEKLKWKFPDISIQANDYLLVLASNEDRKDLVKSWNAEITVGDKWYYWSQNNAPPTNWNSINYSPIGWKEGPSGIGYGDNDDNTTISQTVSVFVRKTFTIDNPNDIAMILFHLDYDDGYIAYLNGKEFSRKNLGAENSQISFDQTATNLHEAEIYTGGFPETIAIDHNQFPLNSGDNVLAIQVHNYSNTSSDLSCIPFLTIGYTSNIENPKIPDSRINLPANYLHSNFKLKSNGEYLLLSDPSAVIIDSLFTGFIPTDKSKGRVSQGSEWKFFDKTTPGKPNPSTGYNGFLDPPIFSHLSGFYANSQTISLSTSSAQAKIYYTFDGSDPTEQSTLYTAPITITSNTPLRSRSYLDGWMPSKVESQTYLFGKQPDIPVMILNANPFDLFDSNSGMYVKGPGAAQDFPHFGANFWEDWERAAQFEILDVSGQTYRANAGIKIFGGWSRGNAQKSFSVFARKKYGTSNFEIQLFPKSEIENYESFVLRNSGNDWDQTMIRDGYVVNIIEDIGIDYQQYRPVISYINGEYWGIYNMREKISEHFISSHHDVPTNHIDLLAYNNGFEDNLETIHGSKNDFLNLIQYISSNDVSNPNIYATISDWMDIEAYIKYQVVQTFIDNRDWPGNNVKLWRDNREGGKWRWILYDSDFGFAFPKWMSDHYKFNTIDFALETNGPGWPNPPWSTFLFRKLMENNSFKHQFINTYCDYLNSIFLPENLNNQLVKIKNGISKYITQHHQRWNQNINWGAETARIKTFNDVREFYVKRHIKSTFKLLKHETINVSVDPPGAGIVKINSINIDQSQWSGDYFPSVPISISAHPISGFKFKEWGGIKDSLSSMVIDVSDISQLGAVFEADLNIDEEKSIPISSKLHPAYPNPFNNAIVIPFDIHIRGKVSITISNILGQKVKSFNYNSYDPGTYWIRWNGLNENNMSVSGGVYIISFNSQFSSDYQKIILLK